MKLHSIAFILLIIGGLNWLLVAFGWDLGSVLGAGIAKIVYILVGLSAVYEVFTHKKRCMNCMKKSMPAQMGNSGMQKM